jgi:glycosyltransferase involved in cell wall biosynthesis
MTLSIIVNSFNQGSTLERTLRSVLEQTCSTQLIVIDAGSTDSSDTIIREYMSDIDIYLNAQSNDLGQSHAINTGMRLATGEIACWINSDDYFRPNSLHFITEYFASHDDCQWLLAACDLYDEHKHTVFATKRITHVDLGLALEYGSRFWLPQQSTFWRTHLYHQVGGLDISDHVTMDVDLFIKFLCVSNPHYLDIITSVYSFHDQSKGALQRKESYISQNELRLNYARQLEEMWKKRGFNPANIPTHVLKALSSDGVRWASTQLSKHRNPTPVNSL